MACNIVIGTASFCPDRFIWKFTSRLFRGPVSLGWYRDQVAGEGRSVRARKWAAPFRMRPWQFGSY